MCSRPALPPSPARFVRESLNFAEGCHLYIAATPASRGMGVMENRGWGTPHRGIGGSGSPPVAQLTANRIPLQRPFMGQKISKLRLSGEGRLRTRHYSGEDGSACLLY